MFISNSNILELFSISLYHKYLFPASSLFLTVWETTLADKQQFSEFISNILHTS